MSNGATVSSDTEGPHEEEVLNLREASQMLGVSTRTLAGIAKAGKIPARKVGREWRFSRVALLEWLRR